MDYKCRLASLGNSSTTSGDSNPGMPVMVGQGLSYSYAIWTYLFLCPFCFFHFSLFSACLLILFLCLIFNLAFLVRKCFGEHTCMGLTFFIALLYKLPLFSL